MKIPNYINYKYELTKKEKEEYKDLYEFEVKEIKYFESLDEDTLDCLWSKTQSFIAGDRPRGSFMKLKLKIKKDGGVNTKWLAMLVLNEMLKRKQITQITFDHKKLRLTDRRVCG